MAASHSQCDVLWIGAILRNEAKGGTGNRCRPASSERGRAGVAPANGRALHGLAALGFFFLLTGKGWTHLRVRLRIAAAVADSFPAWGCRGIGQGLLGVEVLVKVRVICLWRERSISFAWL